jgi:hypothetical protein
MGESISLSLCSHLVCKGRVPQLIRSPHQQTELQTAKAPTTGGGNAIKVEYIYAKAKKSHA